LSRPQARHVRTAEHYEGSGRRSTGVVGGSRRENLSRPARWQLRIFGACGGVGLGGLLVLGEPSLEDGA